MTRTSQTKADYLRQIEDLSKAWQFLLEQVDAESMSQPEAVGDWSVRDVVAHINAWRELTNIRLVAASLGETPNPPWPDGMDEETAAGVDEINRWFIARDRDRQAAEVIAESHEQFRQLREAVEALLADDLCLPGRVAWLGGLPLSAVLDGSFEHLQEHMADIESWLDNDRRPAPASEA